MTNGDWLVLRIKGLAPFGKGFLGALCLVLLLGVGWQVYQWCQQFVVMRQVVGQIIENSQKQQTAQKQKTATE